MHLTEKCGTVHIAHKGCYINVLEKYRTYHTVKNVTHLN